ncbi:unnamed protein product [Nezara viridula]|uniref:Uncharacterized protein n=1 Tax=Nezara viridula TaxID=85310 RepID=A0A9P0HQ91_NEZVI|nr:unnamed protein product [Nezara viridula]
MIGPTADEIKVRGGDNAGVVYRPLLPSSTANWNLQRIPTFKQCWPQGRRIRTIAQRSQA